MAITFRGTAVSFPIYGNDLLNQNLFTIENGIASRVNVVIKKLIIQNDPITALASVMPLVKTSRATSTTSGGISLAKVPFDTSKISNTNVIIRAAIASGNPIVVTAGNPLWEQFTSRLHTAVEQVTAIDASKLPELVVHVVDDFIIKPGEVLLVQVMGATVASNPAISNNWFAQCVWEEEEIGTFAISGTVTLSGSPVLGAKVIVLEADDDVMTNAVLVAIITTNGIGQWSSTIKSGKVGAAFVQYTTGGVYYTAPGSPFLEP
jgi:hypothetical protein